METDRPATVPTEAPPARAGSASRRHRRGLRHPRAAVWAVLGGLCLAYVVGLAVTWPEALVVSDEAAYVNQAELFSRGTTRWEIPDPVTAEPIRVLASDYPPGTSLIQTPLVWLGGWRAAVLASTIALVATVALLARWLAAEGRSPWFAGLLLVHPTVLVMGRLGMSDVPSMALVTGALVAFWHGLGPAADGRGGGEGAVDGLGPAANERVGDEAAGGSVDAEPAAEPAARRWAWPLAGFLAGLALLFREFNPVIVAPFVVGALLRRERRAASLVTGAVAGAVVRLAVSAWLFNDPFSVKEPGSYGGLGTRLEALGLLVGALVVAVPAGLVAVAAYRGRRRPELVTAVVGTVAFYVIYGYSAAQSGTLERIVLAPRFVLPVLPLCIFALAEVVPRWLGPVRRPRLARPALVALVVVGLLSGVGAHLVVHEAGERDARAREIITDEVGDGARIVGNVDALAKVLGPVTADVGTIDRTEVSPVELPSLLFGRPGPVYLVLLDRSGSEFRAAEAAANRIYAQASTLWVDLEPVADEPVGDGGRLRIWEITLK